MIIRMGNQLVFPHYVAIALAAPILLLAQWRMVIYPILPVLFFIFLSSLLNIDSADVWVATFHSLHLLAIALLASTPGRIALPFAKFVVIAYCITIILSQVLIFFGLQSLIEWMLVHNEKLVTTRVSAFATEPSYAAIIILVSVRFIIVIDQKWLNVPRLSFIITSLLATLSLFAVLSAMLLLMMYLVRRGRIREVIGVFIGGAVLLIGISFTDFFAQRLAQIDMSQGARGLGSGTIRLLPYLYIQQILPGNFWPLLVGAGAGTLEPAFYMAVGQYVTDSHYLTAHMAGPIYDYGIPAILPILFLWNRPTGLVDRILYITMTLLVMLNTGIGTYLFVFFGAFALLEQRMRAG
ncbi:MAG: hypothetical protein CMN71_03375 [Sphingomonadaceae bacterium]|nr:hypothetical protein [Sphingomonadaceae bacterium]